eukprot:TRINITY_DN1532_c0_g1_i7.p1 TRINITY_DN1532_c0_g1~~TRINITY_DN1532_c0_g1_i7.p1  ORF type:complete len:816 (+),score=143.36 TRINITY_DN1532_c0_g1_i7:96-2543(+)
MFTKKQLQFVKQYFLNQQGNQWCQLTGYRNKVQFTLLDRRNQLKTTKTKASQQQQQQINPKKLQSWKIDKDENICYPTTIQGLVLSKQANYYWIKVNKIEDGQSSESSLSAAAAVPHEELLCTQRSLLKKMKLNLNSYSILICFSFAFKKVIVGYFKFKPMRSLLVLSWVFVAHVLSVSAFAVGNMMLPAANSTNVSSQVAFQLPPPIYPLVPQLAQQAQLVRAPVVSMPFMAAPVTTMASMVAPARFQASGGSLSFTAPSANIGFAVGGARGVDNFRRNIEEDLLPLPYDLTYEGIFNDYFFDTTNKNPSSACNQLFCPAYSAAISPDPLYPESQNDLYLAVGLDSGLAQSEFARKKLNIVVVVDISGSMSSRFDEFFYDGKQDQRDDWTLSKMQVAKQAVIDMLQHLEPGDQLSIITFDWNAVLELELTPVEDLNMAQLQEKIGSFKAGGSTNMEVGYKSATEQLTNCGECIEGGLEQYENRIIFITDAQPNTGDISSSSLAGLLQQNSQKDIFTTVIGVGLDFNSELIEIMTKTKGANYYNVYSPSDFRKKMDEEFDFMVTPLVFDLKLEIDSESFNDGEGWQVIKVYGSPNIDGGLTKNGTFIEINTLFPTPRTEEGIKGGVVLLKILKPERNIPLILQVSYKDRDTLTNQQSTSTVDVFDNLALDQEFFGSSGVEKAVLLSRYVDLLRGWLIDQHKAISDKKDDIIIPPIFCNYLPLPRKIEMEKSSVGIPCRVPVWVEPGSIILPVFDVIINDNLGRWERTSSPLKVNQKQGQAFSEFLIYMDDTILSLQDENLQQEVDILKKLISISA